MRKKLLLIGLLVVGVALLSSCDLLDQIMNGITGGGTTDGGTTGSNTMASGSMNYGLRATVSLRGNLANPVRTVDRTVGPVLTFTWFENIDYDSVNKKFTATWNGGDLSDTYFEAQLNAAEDAIEYFYVRQTRENYYTWTYVNEIRGYNLPLDPSLTVGSSRTFSVEGSNAHAIVDLLTHREWSLSDGSASDPAAWVSVDLQASSANALIGVSTDFIWITLDY